jgi:hypothetical protein
LEGCAGAWRVRPICMEKQGECPDFDGEARV